MTLFTWNDTYSTGTEQLDEQHKTLISIANRYTRSYKCGHGREILETIFNELINQALVHFADEEDLLRQHGHPDFYRDRTSHDHLATLMVDYQKQFERSTRGIESKAMLLIHNLLNAHMPGAGRNQHLAGHDPQP